MKQAIVCLTPSNNESDNVSKVVFYFVYDNEPPTVRFVTDLLFKCFEEVALEKTKYSEKWLGGPTAPYDVISHLFEMQWHEWSYDFDPLEEHGFHCLPFKIPITAHYHIAGFLEEADYKYGGVDYHDPSWFESLEIRELTVLEADPDRELMVEDPNESNGAYDIEVPEGMLEEMAEATEKREKAYQEQLDEERDDWKYARE